MTKSSSPAARRAVWFCAATCFAAALTQAAVIDTTWIGGTGSWNVPANWSGGVVPNNSGSTSFRVSVPSGTVTVSPGQAISIDALQLFTNAGVNLRNQMTVGGELQINGSLALSSGVMNVVNTALLSGTGTVSIAIGSFSSSSGLEIPASLTVRFAASTSRLGTATESFTNRGHIVGGWFDPTFGLTPSVSGTPFKNLGTIEARNGYLEFSGQYTRADLGELVWGPSGTFGVAGSLQNQNQVFVVDTAHPWWLKAGQVNGGTIQIAPGYALSYIAFDDGLGGGPGDIGATLNDVLVNGTLRNATNSKLIVNGTLAGNADVFLGNGALASSTSSLTIASTVRVQGNITAWIGGDFWSDDSTSVFNHGTLRADNTMRVVGSSLFNDGSLSIGSGGVMAVGRTATTHESVTFGPGGVLDIAMSPAGGQGLLSITGLLDLSTPSDTLILSAGPQIQLNTFYRIVTTNDGVQGTFGSVTPGFELEYRNGTEIWARFVPEPASSILLALPAIRTLQRRRRR